MLHQMAIDPNLVVGNFRGYSNSSIFTADSAYNEEVQYLNDPTVCHFQMSEMKIFSTRPWLVSLKIITSR
jgi:hypothetical protein